MHKVFVDRISNRMIEELKTDKNVIMQKLEKHEDEISSYLVFLCHSEPDEDQEIKDIKQEIYLIYRNEIAQAISKTEVYEHDLSSNVVEAIFELLQDIVSAELAKGEERKKCFNNALIFTYFVNNYVQIKLSLCYIKRIKSYKKQLKNFNIKGCIVDNKSFYKDAKSRFKKLINRYKDLSLKVDSCVMFEDSTQIIDYNIVEKDIGLKEYNAELNNLLLDYEKYYPEIVSSGYKMPVVYRVINILLTIITIGIIFVTVITKVISCYNI